ncbi:MAG: DUF11 domain-containing protein, partial [Myxococcales bacterium]|nr:DUF11 domain-containing protein [Myxococcales bacterium]
TGQGDNVAPDDATVSARTPLPDLAVAVDAPATARPGQGVTVAATYRNLSRQGSNSAVLVFQMPAREGLANATLLSASAPAGVTLYYSTAPLDGPAPTLDPASPGAGWSSTVPAGATWIGAALGPVPGTSPPKTIYLQVQLTDPATGALLLAGDTLTFCGEAHQAVGDPAAEQDLDNNSACDELKLPGVNLTASLGSDPVGSVPGVVAGGSVTLTPGVANTGTVTAYGVTIAPTLAAGLVFVSDTAGTPIIVDASGQESAAVDLTGAAVLDPVVIAQVGGHYVLGSADPASPTYYRAIGLKPGATVTFDVVATASAASADSTTLTSTLHVGTDYQLGWQPGDPEEELLTDNDAQSSVVVYKADAWVDKTMARANGASGAAGLGERLDVTIDYNNLGNAPAEDVVFTDYFPDGTSFVVGSLQGLPGDFALEYYSEAQGWGYTPAGGAGNTDTAVRGFRLKGTLGAPTNGYFNAQGEGLAGGTFAGTRVSGGRLGGTGTSGSYLSPAIPEDGAAVISYGRIVLTDLVARNEGDITVSVIDAATGAPIAGYEGLVPDASGAIDAAGIDPAAYPAIQVLITFGGDGGVAANYASGATHRLPTPRYETALELAYAVNDDDELFAINYDARLSSPTGGKVITPDGAGGWSRRDVTGLDLSSELVVPIYFDTQVAFGVLQYTNSLAFFARDASGAYDLVDSSNFGGLSSDGLHYGHRIDDDHAVFAVSTSPDGSVWSLHSYVLDTAGEPRVIEAEVPIGAAADIITSTEAGVFVMSDAPSTEIAIATPTADYTDYAVEYLTIPNGEHYRGFPESYLSSEEKACFYTEEGSAGLVEKVGGTWTVALLPAPPDTDSIACGGAVGPNGEIIVGRAVVASEQVSVTWQRGPDGDYEVTIDEPIDGQRYLLQWLVTDQLAANYQSRDGTKAIVRRWDGAGLQTLPVALPTDLALSSIFSARDFIGFPVATRSPGFILQLRGGESPYNFAFAQPSADGLQYDVTVLDWPIGSAQSFAYLIGGGGRIFGYDLRYAESGAALSIVSWDVNGAPATAASTQLPPAPAAYFGQVVATGGFNAVGYFDNDDDETIADSDGSGPPTVGEAEGTNTSADFSQWDLRGDALAWVPEVGAEPDDYAYRLLPRPFRTQDNHAVFVTADGYVAGYGTDSEGAPVGLAWQPDGDGYTVAPLVFEGSNQIDLSAMEYVGIQLDADARGNYAGKFAYGEGYDTSGDYREMVVIRDDTLGSGFAVIAAPFDYGPRNVVVDARDAVIGYDDYIGRPTLQRSDAAGFAVKELLPMPAGSEFCTITDIYGGRVLGSNEDGAPEETLLWERDGSGAWQLQNLGAVGVPYGLGPDGQVLVYDDQTGAVSIVRADGSTVALTVAGGPATAVVAAEEDAGYLAALRDGYFLGEWYDDGGDQPTYGVAVGRLPAPGDASWTVDLVTLAEFNGAVLYHQGGSFVLNDGKSPPAYFARQADGSYARYDAPYGTHMNIDENVPFAPALALFAGKGGGGQPTAPALDPTLDGPLAWLPWVDPSVVVPIETRAGSGNDVLTRAASDVFHFSDGAQLELWGAEITSSGSLAGLVVQYRSDAVPSFRYQLEVEDVCQASVSNTMSVSTTTPQASTDNDTSTASLGIATADLRVTVAASKTLVVPGDSLAYTVTVKNVGASPVVGASYSFTPPAALGMASQGGLLVPAGSALAAGQTVTFGPFAATVGDLVDGTTLTAVAGTSQGTPFIDCDHTNDQASATATVANLPNVFVT